MNISPAYSENFGRVITRSQEYIIMSIFRIFRHRLSKASVWDIGAGHWEKEFKPWDAELFAKRGVRPEDLGHTSFPKAEDGGPFTR